LVTDVRAALVAAGVPDASVHTELFGTGAAAPAEPVVAADADVVATLTAQLLGRRTTVPVRTGESLLAAVSRARPDAPFSCRSGVCTTCRALVRQGRATMRVCYGLEPGEVAAGYVLTCQATPTSSELELDFDA
jgi:ring-1,2-phenylacetyl-CoA epoxidase subunit PaaE